MSLVTGKSMKITILGNGGALNDGLPYNAFLVDESLLVETPPDIMLSLARESIAVKKIREIYISHSHGDHAFGFPFVMLSLFFVLRGGQPDSPVTVYVPGKGEDYLLKLSEMALSDNHPCIPWIRRNCRFVEIAYGKELRTGKYSMEPYAMDHFTETWGFVLSRDGKALFSYIADTLWCESVRRMIETAPDVVLVDLNGEPDDPVAVHLSEAELIEKGLAAAGPDTIFYGTHLKKQKVRSNERIHYVVPGQVIDIGVY